MKHGGLNLDLLLSLPRAALLPYHGIIYGKNLSVQGWNRLVILIVYVSLLPRSGFGHPPVISKFTSVPSCKVNNTPHLFVGIKQLFPNPVLIPANDNNYMRFLH